VKNSINQNPDIVGIGGEFNYSLVKTLAEANPELTAQLVVRKKNGISGAERAPHLFNEKIVAIKNPDKRTETRKLITLPENVELVDFDNFLRNFRGQIGKIFLPVLPSNSMRAGLGNIRENVGERAFENCDIVSASKGMENATQKMNHEIIEEVLRIRERVVVLLGGNLAFDLARGKKMITEIAGNPKTIARVAELFANPNLRIYESLDKEILDLGGPVKNVHSVAAGIADAFSDSTVAAVQTRGLPEYERIAAAVGGCSRNEIPRDRGVASDYFLAHGTRNFAAGKKLIELLIAGMSVDAAIAEITREKTIEGLASAIPLRDFVRKLGVDAPLIEAVAAILEQKISVRKAADNLLADGRGANF